MLTEIDVTAAVALPEGPEPTVHEVPSAVMPTGWTIYRSASLVRDIAHNMYDIPVILEKHGLSQEQYERLKDNKFFKEAVEATTLEWNEPQNTKRRLALEAAIAIEDSLPDVVARLSKANEPLPGVVALLKLLSEIAGVSGTAAASQPQAVGAKFNITFNLGDDRVQHKVVDVTKEIAHGPIEST
jgi:hypothetical protein